MTRLTTKEKEIIYADWVETQESAKKIGLRYGVSGQMVCRITSEYLKMKGPGARVEKLVKDNAKRPKLLKVKEELGPLPKSIYRNGGGNAKCSQKKVQREAPDLYKLKGLIGKNNSRY